MILMMIIKNENNSMLINIYCNFLIYQTLHILPVAIFELFEH